MDFYKHRILSVVAHREKEDMLLVRARRSGEIESIFPDASVYEIDNADYHYRAEIERDKVAQVMADQIKNIGYDNFKSSVSDNKRRDAYMDIWSVMYAYQSSELKR